MEALRARNGVSARALEFVILVNCFSARCHCEADALLFASGAGRSGRFFRHCAYDDSRGAASWCFRDCASRKSRASNLLPHQGNVINDETGDHLTDAEEAMARAAVIAQELADGAGQWRGLSVEVFDAHGTEVGRVPISG